MNAVIEPLLSRGLAVSLVGDRIRLQPKALIDDEVRAYMQTNRQQIIEALSAPVLPLDPLEGLEVLPDDHRFIEAMLARFRYQNRYKLLKEYRDCWLEAASAPGLREHQRQGVGRTAANTWLRTRLH